MGPSPGREPDLLVGDARSERIADNSIIGRKSGRMRSANPPSTEGIRHDFEFLGRQPQLLGYLELDGAGA